jgi:hypothetical protein
MYGLGCVGTDVASCEDRSIDGGFGCGYGWSGLTEVEIG